MPSQAVFASIASEQCRNTFKCCNANGSCRTNKAFTYASSYSESSCTCEGQYPTLTRK